MSETGATPAQIEAGAQRWAEVSGSVEVNEIPVRYVAQYLVPPDHRIIGPEEIEAWRRIVTVLKIYDLDDMYYNQGFQESAFTDLGLLAALVEESR